MTQKMIDEAVDKIRLPQDYMDQDGEVDLTGLVNEDGSLSEDAEGVIHLALQIMGTAAHYIACDKGWYEGPESGLPFEDEIKPMLHSLKLAALESDTPEEPFHYSIVIHGEEVYGRPKGVAPELGRVLIQIANLAHGRQLDVGRGVVEQLRFARTKPSRGEQ